MLLCLGLVSALLAAANVAGTIFHHGNGGLGFFDFRGAANALAQEGPYTAERALDLVSAWARRAAERNCCSPSSSTSPYQPPAWPSACCCCTLCAT
ncbi:MAG: hypothetical protein M3460_25865 [Actinomycetota bacterium]|nr:hypothetical protein [Actinomycetota bacterium]